MTMVFKMKSMQRQHLNIKINNKTAASKWDGLGSLPFNIKPQNVRCRAQKMVMG